MQDKLTSSREFRLGDIGKSLPLTLIDTECHSHPEGRPRVPQ